MKILRAESLGMCFGVRDALALAIEAQQQQPITVLGDLVHNESVLADLQDRGIRIAREISDVATRTVMITAHGASDHSRGQLLRQGFRLIDGTCPLVQYAHESLRMLARTGYHPVVIGRREHVEVRGLTGDLESFDVILGEEDVARLKERPRFGVAAQTTHPLHHARGLVELLRGRFPRSEVRFLDTVCQPTKQRQAAAERLAMRCDVVIVIGGSHSNNTRELASTCRRHCSRVHHVQGAADLDPSWLAENDTVGITAGTSTPDAVIRELEDRLTQLAKSHLCLP